MTNVTITPTDNGPYQVNGPVTDLTPEAAIAVVESFMGGGLGRVQSVGGGSLRDRGFRHHLRRCGHRRA